MILSLFGKKASCFGKKEEEEINLLRRGNFVANRNTCSLFLTMRPNMEAKRLLGIMKDSSIQEGSERKERRRSTELFVERKYCLRVEVFGGA